MNLIDGIRAKFSENQLEFSKHAVDRMILRHITVAEIREAIYSGDVIEDYPDDKYGPSCLILGFTGQERPLHIQCSYPARTLIKVVTVYEPDSNEWLDFKIRIG
jgi:hypothetical protein